jgi:hypothetical protein
VTLTAILGAEDLSLSFQRIDRNGLLNVMQTYRNDLVGDLLNVEVF